MVVQTTSDNETAGIAAIAAIEAGIVNLSNGNVGSALDDLLASRLLLTVVLATLNADTPGERRACPACE